MFSLLALFKSSGLFSKVASLCPPLYNISPFEKPFKIFKYYKRSSVTFKRALMIFAFSRFFYASESEWSANDPIQLSKNYNATYESNLYLSCGIKDDWGCLEGTKVLSENYSMSGGRIDFKIVQGGHCDIDTISLSKFLIN